MALRHAAVPQIVANWIAEASRCPDRAPASKYLSMGGAMEKRGDLVEALLATLDRD